MNDSLALLAAIRTNQDEDTPRLMYADYLDGLDPERPYCENCKCTCWEPGREGHERCSDCLGVELDTSNAARAELIRVQCELANAPPNAPVCGRQSGCRVHHWCVHYDRECELLAAHADRWRRGPVCGNAKCLAGRPFTSCPSCHGTGDAGGLMRTTYNNEAERPLVPVTYHRGFPRVECRAADVWCKPYGGMNEDDYAPTPWALAVCKHHQDVCEFWIDLPFDGQEDGGDYSWLKSSLPPAVFDMVQGHPNEPTAARTALARAVVQWVHEHLATPLPTPSILTHPESGSSTGKRGT